MKKLKIIGILLILIWGFVFLSCLEPQFLNPPTNLTASDGLYTDKIEITWNAVRGADKYNIYMSETATGNYTLIGSSISNIFNAKPENTEIYYFKVSAANNYGESEMSNYDSGNLKAALPHPLNFNSSDGVYRDRIVSTWNAVSGATKYNVYRADSPTGTFSYIGEAITTTYSDYPGNMQLYYYRVVALNNDGYSDPSNYDSGYLKELLPPTNVQASDGEYRDKIEITWDSMSDINGYKVYRSLSQSSGYTLLTPDLIGNNYYTDYPSDTQTYYYRVRVFDNWGDSDNSSSDSGSRMILPAPSTLVASDNYTNRVEISWQEVDIADNYKLYRSDSENGTYTLLDDSITTTSYDDVSLTDTDTYYYKVKSSDAYGESDDFSNTNDGKLTPALDTPINLDAGDREYRDRIEITWNTVSNADGYRIYRSTSQNSGFTFIDTSTTNSCIDNDNPGNTVIFYYKINAYSSNGFSNYSSVDDGSIKILSVPSNLSADQGLNRVDINIDWNSVTDADGYRLYRSTSQNSGYNLLIETGNTDYIDDDYPGNTSNYYYKIRSYDNWGTSELSSYVIGYRKSLQVPSGLWASNNLSREYIEITWNEITDPDATGYIISRATSATGTYTNIHTVTNTSTLSYFDNENEYQGDTNTYYYKIRSYDAYGSSEYSSYVSGKRKSLPIPTGLSASHGTSREDIYLSWNELTDPDVTGYIISRATSATGTYTNIYTANNISYTTYTDDDYPGVTDDYYYKIRSYDAYGYSEYSSYIIGYREELDSPTGVDASDGISREYIDIDWYPVSGATHYVVYRSTYAYSGYSAITGLLTSSSYLDYPPDSETYYYKIKAKDSYGYSEFSAYDSGYTTGLEAPDNVEASDGDFRDRIYIHWSSVSNANSYKIYRATSYYGTYYYEGSTSDLYYDDYTIDDLDTYYYKVSAVDSHGEGDLSDYDRGYLSMLQPPDGIDASKGTYSNKIEITWNSVNDYNGSIEYKVYRSTSAYGSYSYLYTTNYTYYDDTDSYLESGTYYYYKIKSVDDIGESDYSGDYDYGYISSSSTSATHLQLETWTNDTISQGEEIWYYFNAYSGDTYDIEWSDVDNRNIADIIVSAYREDMTTSYFVESDDNTESIIANATERVYLKVETYDSSGYGDFSIRVSDTGFKK